MTAAPLDELDDQWAPAPRRRARSMPAVLRTLARVTAPIRRVAKAVGVAIAWLVLAVLAIPVIYLPGLLALPFRLLARRGGSNWQPPSAASAQRRDARLPFLAPPRPVVRRRHVGGLVVVALLVGVVVVQRQHREDRQTPPLLQSHDTSTTGVPVTGGQGGTIADRLDAVPWSKRPAFAGVAWADALQRETLAVQLVERPGTGFGLGDHAGRYVNVRGGVRASLASPCRGCPTTRLYLAGGSLVFGVGERDDHTIASELVRLAAADGVNLDIVNLGVPGWTLAQEAADLRERLAKSPHSADLVVFLDGFNDTVAGYLDLAINGRLPQGDLVFDGALADKLLDPRTAFPDFSATGYGRTIARRYRATAAPLDRALRADGMDVVRFFQPDASATATQRGAVDALHVLPADFYARTRLDQVLGATADALHGDHVADLRGLFDGVDRPEFIDTAHVDEQGARRIAEAIYAAVGSKVRDAAR